MFWVQTALEIGSDILRSKEFVPVVETFRLKHVPDIEVRLYVSRCIL